ncbi:bifunctional protein-disulfide isomerase/oxidoreductase DsbC [Citrobacter sp. JGM124]|uniref:bifunctional protein-disulfide isomerase/oxidoreductase DsbC n=1 Tax=Citrobacter sp. JGM124 TaxID=2799789 RepID=UPI001BACA62D|nr:bifunctional protein-disulfide isomerase/oxidoreductase DsbC [Citrobacter sp. JGM124]MBS0849366.1 bifunctional protein-disulfide isomerase/oxidoreductase DsbC [Citrobacter sp. JGM124]
MKKTFFLLSLLMAAMSGVAQANDAAIKQSLGKLGIDQADIQNAPVKGLKTVLTDNGILYMTEDGKYVLQGTLYDISSEQPVNVTNQLLMGKLNALEKDMVIYKAPDEKHVITVFTDITCGYCHKLHEEMKDYNGLGITVRYLAFPRQGLQSQAAADMKSIWCAKDRAKAFDTAMSGGKVVPASCDTSIADQYNLGVQFGIKGTPAIVLEDGTIIPGYQGPKEMKQMLDAHQKMTKTSG